MGCCQSSLRRGSESEGRNTDQPEQRSGEVVVRVLASSTMRNEMFEAGSPQTEQRADPPQERGEDRVERPEDGEVAERPSTARELDDAVPALVPVVGEAKTAPTSETTGRHRHRFKLPAMLRRSHLSRVLRRRRRHVAEHQAPPEVASAKKVGQPDEREAGILETAAEVAVSPEPVEPRWPMDNWGTPVPEPEERPADGTTLDAAETSDAATPDAAKLDAATSDAVVVQEQVESKTEEKKASLARRSFRRVGKAMRPPKSVRHFFKWLDPASSAFWVIGALSPQAWVSSFLLHLRFLSVLAF